MFSPPGTDTIPLTSLNNWCSNDYDELLPGHFMETNIGEILCHNRQSGKIQYSGSEIIVSTRYVDLQFPFPSFLFLMKKIEHPVVLVVSVKHLT